MSCTTTELLSHMKGLVAINAPYIYGGKGQTCTQNLIDSLTKSYPTHYTSTYREKAAKFIGQKVYDCSGAISTATGVVEGSAQMKANAKECVPVSQFDENKHKGWVLWRSGHVGAVVEDGVHCYESRGINYGAVRTVWKTRNFTHLLLVNGLVDANETGVQAIEEVTETKGYVKTNGGKLHLRAAATTSSTSLTQMPNGSELTIIAESTSWYKVKYNGKTGYAYKTYVTKTKPTTSTNTSSTSSATQTKTKWSAGKKYTVIASSGLTIRPSAGSTSHQTYSKLSASGKTVAVKTADGKGYKLKKGQNIDVLAVKMVGTDVWLQIGSGWVCAQKGTSQYVSS